ncbi:MAG: RHS repeat domain-containing protein [Chloroflexota bacterium]
MSIADGAGRTVSSRPGPRQPPRRPDVPRRLGGGAPGSTLGRLVSVTDGAGHQSTFAYDAVGNLVDERLENGVATTLTWDAAGRLSSSDTALGAAPLSSFEGQQDASGRCLAGGRRRARTVGHDAVEQLAAVGMKSFASFDAAGDLTSLRDATLAYDAGGRLASMGGDRGTTDYEFDASGRRIAATAAASTVGYGYDGAGRDE